MFSLTMFPQSSEGMPLSVTAENINCFESGFICRKSLVVTVGQSSIAIDEDNGNPVRTDLNIILTYGHLC